jgi:hypothetical protein
MRQWGIVGSVRPLYGPGRQRSHASTGQPDHPARTILGRPRVILGRAAGGRCGGRTGCAKRRLPVIQNPTLTRWAGVGRTIPGLVPPGSGQVLALTKPPCCTARKLSCLLRPICLRVQLSSPHMTRRMCSTNSLSLWRRHPRLPGIHRRCHSDRRAATLRGSGPVSGPVVERA